MERGDHRAARRHALSPAHPSPVISLGEQRNGQNLNRGGIGHQKSGRGIVAIAWDRFDGIEGPPTLPAFRIGKKEEGGIVGLIQSRDAGGAIYGRFYAKH